MLVNLDSNIKTDYHIPRQFIKYAQLYKSYSYSLAKFCLNIIVVKFLKIAQIVFLNWAVLCYFLNHIKKMDVLSNCHYPYQLHEILTDS